MGERKIAALFILLLVFVATNGLQHHDGGGSALYGGIDQLARIQSREWLLSLRGNYTPEPGLLDKVGRRHLVFCTDRMVSDLGQ
ncbi:unnamed protein product [Arctogadus glacialis]